MYILVLFLIALQTCFKQKPYICTSRSQWPCYCWRLPFDNLWGNKENADQSEKKSGKINGKRPGLLWLGEKVPGDAIKTNWIDHFSQWYAKSRNFWPKMKVFSFWPYVLASEFKGWIWPNVRNFLNECFPIELHHSKEWIESIPVWIFVQKFLKNTSYEEFWKNC